MAEDIHDEERLHSRLHLSTTALADSISFRRRSVKGTSPVPRKTATSSSSSSSTTATKKKTTTGGATKATGRTKTTGSLKKGTLASKAGGKKGTTKKGAKKKGPTAEELAMQKKQNDAALIIQSQFRGFKTKKELEKQKREREEMEKQMEELRKQAWLAEIERQRKIDAERRKKMMEEAKRRKEEVSLRKKLLEMAYDGEVDELEKLWSKATDIFKGDVGAVEVADGHGTTLLSEAAAGGQVDAVSWLLAKGAHPNSLGEFSRTPIWRACFLGHAPVVSLLLEGGGDPRIASESGEAAKNVASTDEIKAILAEWDLGKTDALAKEWEKKQEERLVAEQKAKDDMMVGLSQDVESAQIESDQMQKLLKNAHQEYEKRIFEYDTCVQESKPQSLLDVALTSIKEAEKHLEDAKAKANVARETLQMAKLSLREQEREGAEAGMEEEAGIYVEMKDLDDVLIKDVGDKVKKSGMAACVIDTSKQTSVFLRYLDTNYVNALSRHNMETNRLRRSIVGSIRYGKPLVLDLMDVDVWESVKFDLDLVKKDLLAMLMDRSILKDEAYLSLVKESDGEEYHPTKFSDERAAKFKLIILTAERFPAKEITDNTYCVRVLVKGS